MNTTIENDFLVVKTKKRGAELSSIILKENGRECLWQGDPNVWAGQAPLLFPYCGSLKNDTLLAEGKEYPATKHGFARNIDFVLVDSGADKITYQLCSSAGTEKNFPYSFELLVEYTLDANKLLQKVTVVCPQDAGKSLPFSLGFHPAFSLVLAQGTETQDHVLEFDVPESPLVHQTPGGLISGETYTLFNNKSTIDVTDDMFAKDSLCMSNLQSNSLSIKNKKTGSAVTVGIAGFPYVLLWGPAKGPLGFLCIEPWLSLPDKTTPTGDFSLKDDIKILAPGQAFSSVLSVQFS